MLRPCVVPQARFLEVAKLAARYNLGKYLIGSVFHVQKLAASFVKIALVFYFSILCYLHVF